MPNKDFRKKIGQLFLVGFEGRSQPAHLKELVSRYHVGGIILFARNISEPLQAWELLRSFKSRELIRAIDHEGGRVNRLPPPVTHFPAPRTIGDTGSEKLAFEAGRCQAAELAAIGFGLNFAPVLDIHSNPVNQVIGDRAFGTDAHTVARLGVAFARGIQAAGVAACGKHFPGHGDTRGDSHALLPVSAASENQLAARELLPFQAAIKGGIDCIMTAHVQYDGIDSQRPATLSSAIVEGLLRRRLGYVGAIVSDDMEMRGITDHFDAEESAILALNAGVDMLLFCHSVSRQVAAIEAIYKAVDGRIIKPERILEAHARTEPLRTIARTLPVAGNAGQLMAVLNNPEHKRLAASLG